MSDPASVNARFTQAILQAVVRHGVRVPEALHQALTQGARVPMAQQDKLWSLFTQATTDPLAALAVGTDVQAGHLDIVGMLLLSCDTLGDGLEVLTEYAPIIGDNAHFDVSPDDQGVVLRYQPAYTVCVQQRVEAALGCVVGLADDQRPLSAPCRVIYPRTPCRSSGLCRPAGLPRTLQPTVQRCGPWRRPSWTTA